MRNRQIIEDIEIQIVIDRVQIITQENRKREQ